jgi:hypothetical protein
VVALAVGVGVASYRYRPALAAAEAKGLLVLSSNPSGAMVTIDGTPQGRTPFKLEVTAGEHVVELRGEGEPRTIPVTVVAGTTMSQHVELPLARVETGQLQVHTDPSGASVTVDGVAAGVAPLTIGSLTPGPHTVVLTNDRGSVKHEVVIEAGVTASLVASMAVPQGAPVSGWISVSVPVDVQIYEDNRLLGTSQTDRIMVSMGRHELDIINEALGYKARRTVTVSPGQVSNITLELPKGSMSINAQPWAEVWIDGERAGETPIGNVAVPIGPHKVTFRHPELGEKVVDATVSLTGPTRISADLREK